MINKISLDGNIVITAAKKVTAICKPLIKNLDILAFRYARIYADGSKFILSNNPDYLRFLYEEGHYENTWYDNGKPASQFVTGCHLWAIDKLATNEKENWVGTELNKLFQFTDGLFFCFKQTGFVELFDFFSTNSNIYFIKKQLLNRFMLYFREQAKKLIQIGENEKIYTPQTKPTQDKFIGIDEPGFINSTPLHSFYNDNFTNREKQILNYLPRGRTAKQIGLILGISHRTVERHLENIKAKTNIDSKSELIEKLFFQEIEL